MEDSSFFPRPVALVAVVFGVTLLAGCSSDETVPVDSVASAPVVPPAATPAPESPRSGEVIGGEKVLSPIIEGMANDSIFAFTGPGPFSATGSDSLKIANGYLRTQVQRPSELITVIWYRNTPGKLTDPIFRALNTPIVLGEQRVKGWGWRYYDRVADSLGLPKVVQ